MGSLNTDFMKLLWIRKALETVENLGTLVLLLSHFLKFTLFVNLYSDCMFTGCERDWDWLKLGHGFLSDTTYWVWSFFDGEIWLACISDTVVNAVNSPLILLRYVQPIWVWWLILRLKAVNKFSNCFFITCCFDKLKMKILFIDTVVTQIENANKVKGRLH